MIGMALQLEIFDTGVSVCRRDSGERKVLASNEAWRDPYTAAVDAWFRALPPSALFTGEDLRHHALIAGVKRPNHHNAWSAAAGGLIRGWLKAGCAEITGEMVRARSAKTHAHALRQYRKV